jgi:NodT family efflux transporter outer membrane factor (OMF) lipoprotein
MTYAQRSPMTTLISRLAVPAAALFLLAGCASMGSIEPQAKLRDGAALALDASATAAVPAQWWRQFGDEQLNRLVEQALADNPSLHVAQARLARARAASDAAGAALLPQVNGSFDLMRQRYSEHGLVPPPLGGAVLNTATAQVNAGWEIDFFGKNRAALESAIGSTRAAQAQADAARILLAANVTRAYLQLARTDDQLEVAQRTLAQREQSLRLVRDRVNAGLDTSLELRQSEGGLPEARQQIEALQEQATLSRNALAALVGQPNARVVTTAPRLAAFKPVVLASVIPADLLGQRADIVAARWRVEAAGSDIKNARAQFYPDINLAAFAGLSSLGLGELLHTGSLQWGVGPAIRLPIFEAGRLRANLRGKTADYDAAVESYNATVIDAIHEVGDQIASGKSVALQQAEQREAARSGEAAYEIALQRYKAGLGNYLNVLAAESAVLAQRRLAVDLAARALDAQVGLARALGGGYVPATESVAAASK